MKVYITEPELIHVDVVAQILGDGYKIVVGDTTLQQNYADDIEVLLIKSQTKVGVSELDKLPSLKHIVRSGVGLDNIDIAAAEARNIQIHSAPGANSNAVAEYVVASVLAALRKLHCVNQQQITAWSKAGLLGRELAEQTVGIVGYGFIGKLLHAKFAALGVKQFYIYDPYAESVSDAELVPLAELLQKSTIVSLHVPLIEQTKHLINTDMLSHMQDTALLVNAARGGIVDELAVINKVQNSPDFTYIADVVENEPAVRPELLTHKNIILTPHIAGSTDAALANSLQLALENFQATVREQVDKSITSML